MFEPPVDVFIWDSSKFTADFMPDRHEVERIALLRKRLSNVSWYHNALYSSDPVWKVYESVTVNRYSLFVGTFNLGTAGFPMSTAVGTKGRWPWQRHPGTFRMLCPDEGWVRITFPIPGHHPEFEEDDTCN